MAVLRSKYFVKRKTATVKKNLFEELDFHLSLLDAQHAAAVLQSYLTDLLSRTQLCLPRRYDEDFFSLHSGVPQRF